MAKVSRYQTEGVPRRAPQLAPVDAGSLIETLGNFQAQAQSEAIDAASRAASGLGSRQGIEAAQGGEDLPSGRTDTAAGQSFTKAARASYMGQLENDVQEVSDEFNRKWKAGEYGEDAEQWSNGFDAALSGTTKGLDEETRAVYGPRIDSISNRTKKAVFDDFQERTRLSQVADVSVALDKVGDDLLGFARDGDLESLETTLAVYDQYLADGVEGRLFTDPEAITLKMDMMDDLTAEAHVGEFLEADDMRAYLDNFKEKRPSDLTPAKHEELAANMEARLKKIETEFSKQEAYSISDAAIAKTDNYAEQRAIVKELAGDNAEARDMAEDKLRENLVATEKSELIDQTALGDATMENIIKGDVLPAEIIADPDLKGKLKASLHDYAKKFMAGEKVETDLAVYSKLYSMKPAELAEETPLEYVNKLDETDYKSFVQYHNRQVTAHATGQKSIDDGTTAQALSNAVKEMGWKSTGPLAGKLGRVAREAINRKALEQTPPRELDFAEKTEIINGLLVQGEVVRDWAYDPDMTLLQALETPNAARWKVTSINSVPFVERQAIETVLKERKIAPTDANVLFEYNESLGVK